MTKRKEGAGREAGEQRDIIRFCSHQHLPGIEEGRTMLCNPACAMLRGFKHSLFLISRIGHSGFAWRQGLFLFEEIKLYSLSGDTHDLNSKLKKVCVLFILNFQNFNNMACIYDRNDLYLNFGHLDVFGLSHRVCVHFFFFFEQRNRA